MTTNISKKPSITDGTNIIHTFHCVRAAPMRRGVEPLLSAPLNPLLQSWIRLIAATRSTSLLLRVRVVARSANRPDSCNVALLSSLTAPAYYLTMLYSSQSV
jgi:hypothetical protein